MQPIDKRTCYTEYTDDELLALKVELAAAIEWTRTVAAVPYGMLRCSLRMSTELDARGWWYDTVTRTWVRKWAR